MQAIVQDAYGTEPEAVLRLAEIARPTIGDDEVLVRVVGGQRRQGHVALMTGLPYAMRLAGFGVAGPKASNPGRSLAGTVESVGTDVTDVRAGRRGVRHLRRLVRRVRVRQRGQARAQADEPLLRAGRGRPHLRRHRAPGRPQGEGAARADRCWSSARRAASAPSPCRSPRPSAPRSPACAAPTKVDLVRSLGADHVIDYTARGLHRRRPPLRRHPRHRRQPPAVPPPARADATRHARHRRRRDRRPLARRVRPLARAPCCSRRS